MKNLFIGVLLLLFLSACELDIDTDDENVNKEVPAGPCVQIEREPVIKLQSVSDSVNEENILQVQISNLVYEDETVIFQEDHNQFATNIYIDYELDSLFCTLPCAFLTGEGNYQFTISADDYNDIAINIDASYSIFDGGCPSYVDGGSEFNFKLSKEQE